MIKIRELIGIVVDKMLSLPGLPGQGAFGSEESETLDFTVSLYESEMPATFTKKNMEAAANGLVDEYRDCVETQYTMALDKTACETENYDACSADKFYHKIDGKSDIVTSEKVGTFISNSMRFKPTDKHHAFGKIRYVGTLGKAKVYINPYVRRNEVYVIDRSIIDLKYEVGQDESKSVRVMVRARTNPGNAKKYLFDI